MNYPIKLIYLSDEETYYCLVDGMVGIEGTGETEEDAIGNFYNNLHKLMRE